MASFMRYLVCLLLSIAAGSGAYALGAVVWSALDPQGAGARLLFTIPLALGGTAIPGILGMLCLVFRCDLIPEPPAKKQLRPLPQLAAARPAPARPARRPRPAAAATAPATAVAEEMELVLAT